MVNGKSRLSVRRLVIILVVGIAAVIGFVWYEFSGGLDYSKDTAAQSDLYALSTQLEIYKNEHGRYPSTEDGLKALTDEDKETYAGTKFHQLMKFIPLDPWHRLYRYLCPGHRRPHGFDLYSVGPDGIEIEDDLYAPDLSAVTKLRN